jgi:fumarate reductase subunit D
MQPAASSVERVFILLNDSMLPWGAMLLNEAKGFPLWGDWHRVKHKIAQLKIQIPLSVGQGG